MKHLIASFVSAIFSLAAAAQINRPSAINPAKANTSVNVNSIIVTDLAVVIDDISYTAGNYTISYTLKNTGTTPVDLSNITMQGYIYNQDGIMVNPGGGILLKYDGVINAGKEFKGKLGCNDNNVYKDWSYKYVLKADEKNTLSETNENNNSAELPIQGYRDALASVNAPAITKTQKIKGQVPTPAPAAPVAPPPAKPLPDLVITAGSISKKADNTYEVQFTMKNIGRADVEIGVNGIRTNGRVLYGNITTVNTYYQSKFAGRFLKPGETQIEYYTINPAMLNLLQHGVQYEYLLTIDYITDIKESNEGNNDFKINFRMGY